jgi:hypothetical protein
MDEVSFGPKGEARLSARHRRVLTAGAAGVIVAGVVVAVLATGQHRSANSRDTARQPAVHPAAAGGDWLPVNCPRLHVVPPSLASLPVGMRPGALQVFAETSFVGQCVVVLPAASAG